MRRLATNLARFGACTFVALLAAACESTTANRGPQAEAGALGQPSPAPATLASTPTPPPLKAAETFDAAWTIVRDTHFDPTFGGVDWEQVRVELRPKAEAAETSAELRETLTEMLGRLKQSHFAIIPAEVREGHAAGAARADAPHPGAGGAPQPGAPTDLAATPREDDHPPGAGTLGVDLRVVDGAALVTAVEAGSAGEASGIRTGWTLESVDDIAVGDVLAMLQRELGDHAGSWASFQAAQVALEMLDGDDGDIVRMRLRDGTGKIVDVDAVLRPQPGEVVELGDLPPLHVTTSAREVTVAELEIALGAPSADNARAVRPLDIGVIAFNIWMVPVARPVHEAVDRFRKADGIIIDLRGNPGGIGAMAMGIAGHFCATPISLGTMKARGGEMKFLVNPRRTTAQGAITEPYGGPVAILVDEMTASTSEIFAGGLQAQHRVRVFGRTSAGAALPAHMARLPSNDTLLHAIADFTTADGVRLEGRGVVPDEAVPLTRDDLLAGRDATLLAAVRWIAQARSPAQPDRAATPEPTNG